MNKFKTTVWQLFRNIRIGCRRMRVNSTKSRSILCNNCLGGVVAHDFGLRFCSPFVNLWIPTNHYIEILENIAFLDQYTFRDITPDSSTYPIGLLNDKWEVHFMHYQSYEEAVWKWNERVLRMDVNNAYVLCVKTHSATDEDLKNFDKLSFKNKLLITGKPYPEIKCAVVLKNYNESNANGEILWPSNRWGMCTYDQIDWIKFLDLN